jgi:hypothetical protein
MNTTTEVASIAVSVYMTDVETLFTTEEIGVGMADVTMHDGSIIAVVAPVSVYSHRSF